MTGSGTNLYLTHVTNPHGQALIIDRNSDNGQINTITEPVSGEYLSFTYGTAGNNFPAPIINISDSAGRTVSLSYDGNDMLTNVIRPTITALPSPTIQTAIWLTRRTPWAIFS